MTDLVQLSNHLKTIKPNEWKKLFDLLDEMGNLQKFGELHYPKKQKDGLFMAPFWQSSEIGNKFFKTVHELGIVPVFDWTSWKEGKEILNNQKQDYSDLDSITLCKLLTTIIRTDKFAEGYLILCFQDGIIQKILSSLKNRMQTV